MLNMLISSKLLAVHRFELCLGKRKIIINDQMIMHVIDLTKIDFDLCTLC